MREEKKKIERHASEAESDYIMSRLSYYIIEFKIIGKTTPSQNKPNILNLHEIDAHKQLEHVPCILSSSLRGLSVGMHTCIDPNPSITSCDD